MRLDVGMLHIALFFVIGCKAASFIADQKDTLFDVITQGRIQDLSKFLKGDVTEKLFEVDDEGTEIMISPLELAAACHNPQIMSLMIETKHSVISIDTFEMVFRTSCVECFDVLLDHSNLSWSLNRIVCEKIIRYSLDYAQFFVFFSKLSKRLDFNDKLALIETAFDSCTDQEKLSLAADSVILDIAYVKIVTKCSKYAESAAVISFLRAMIFKNDFDDMIPWIDLLYHRHPQTETSKLLIQNYKEHVKVFDDRVEEYTQPEVFIAQNGIQVYLKSSESLRNNIKSDGARVLLRLLNKNNKFIWDLFESTSYHEEIKKEINRSLDFSVKNNLVQLADSLLEAGFKHSESSIIDAVSNGSAEMVELLINYGTNPNASNILGDTPLILASRKGAVPIVELLLKHDADPNIANRSGNTALMEAAEKGFAEIVTLLLSHKACPNVSNNGSETALIKAVIKGSEAVVDILLKNGAHPNVADKYRNTPLIAAIMKGSVDIVKMLLNYGADPNFFSCDNETPLIKAIRNSQVEIVKILLDHGAELDIANKYNDTPLILASKYSSLQVVELLLKYKARPNDSNSRGNTALIEATNRDSHVIVELLLKYGAEPNVANIFSDTPLNAAAYNGSINIVELLLNYGADPNYATGRRKLALITAIEKGFIEIVEILLSCGADPRVIDGNGYTPSIIAAKNGLVDLERTLLNLGAD